MIDKMYTNIIMFVIICFLIYFIFSNLNTIEGMTTKNNISLPDKQKPATHANAANYAAVIKSENINMQDQLLINKYKKDYENAIIAVDDLVNLLMLKTVLSVDRANPTEALTQLASLNQSKGALNSVMKYIDNI
jgi:hypothetical protein